VRRKVANQMIIAHGIMSDETIALSTLWSIDEHLEYSLTVVVNGYFKYWREFS